MSEICSDSNCLFSPARKWPFGTSRDMGSVCEDCGLSRISKRKSLSTASQSPSPKRRCVLNTSPGQPRTPQASPFDRIRIPNTPQPATPGTPQQPMALLSHFVVGLPPVSCKQDPPVSCKQDPFVDEQFVPSATPNGLAPPTESPAATIVTDWQPLKLLAAGSSSAGSPVAASPSAGSPIAARLFTGCLISFFDTEAEVGAGSTPFGGY